MDKSALFGATLGRLSVEEAVALARVIELRRLRGREALPTDQMLAALRPQLRAGRAPRIPALCRLVAGGFEHFLVDSQDEPRPPGCVARAVLVPWWEALKRIAGAELAPFEAALADCFTEAIPASTESLALRAQAAAAGWTRTLAEELAKPRGAGALGALFPRLGLVADIRAIATLLTLAEPLTEAFAAIDRALAMNGRLDGRQIIDLVPDAIAVAKRHYLALSEARGMDSVFLALGLLNRLRRPWEILRLGRALMRKPNDAVLHDTEFAAIGDRLIQGLRSTAQGIVALAAPRGGAVDAARMAAAVTGYADDVEGLLGEFGFRRDSPWGEAILETRVAIADAVGRDFQTHLAAQLLRSILPAVRHGGAVRGLVPGPDPSAPPAEADATAAVETARLLLLLQQRGARHGFGQNVHETVEMIGAEIDARVGLLLDTLGETPSHPAIETRIAAAARVLDVLFEASRGQKLTRRLGLARQAAV
ncbi:MAG TPA: hypothetical protein VMU87_00115 [Stellaceae bacterium]|nr:hypothetical protein [Stellaceae bacterium]